jgi:hypothetical protein
LKLNSIEDLVDVTGDIQYVYRKRDKWQHHWTSDRNERA